MLPNEENKNDTKKEDIKLLGKKKEREKEPKYISNEEAFNTYEYKSKNFPKDIELIKSYSINVYQRLKQSPIEIINIVVSPFTKFNDFFVEIYDKLLDKIQHISTTKKLIIKYIYNNGTIHTEPVEFPCDSNNIINDLNNEKNDINSLVDNNSYSKSIENNNIIKDDDNYKNNDNNKEKKEINPFFVTLNVREVWTALKEYKWEGLIKIIILFGDNGFCKQILKNIDCYHNNYLIINLNTINQKQKNHFNNIINNIYAFDDIISCLKQDIYECSLGKSNIKELSDKFNDYNDLLKRYLNYNYNSEPIINNDKISVFGLTFYHKNFINIYKNEFALYDSNSCSKTFISICYTSKIKRENEKIKENILNLPNFINPEIINNNIGVELSISNNIYNILNNDYNEENLNIHINNLTLGKKMIGYANSKIIKNKFNQDYFINNILLNYAICDYICDLFNMRLYSNNINLNTIEIHLYEFTNYNIQYLIAKEYLQNCNHKYNDDILNCFSHFSFCISYGKILIDNIKEYNGKIYSFDILKDNDNYNDNYNLNELNDEEQYINIFKFFCYHKCNKYCNILGVNNIIKNFYNINPDTIETFKNKRICEICKSIFKIDNKYNYNKDNLCLCFECYNKIYESKYIRVCLICENKFEYLYNYYILQKIETPSMCKNCEKLKLNENNVISDSEEIEENNKPSEKIKEEKFIELD